jgi:hypothetical protein
MRYFRIYADKKNLQPRFPDWYSLIRPGIWRHGQIYEALEARTYLKAELEEEMELMDIISSPCFMVSKGFADLIRMYRPGIQFKQMALWDEKGRKTVPYLVPNLPEIECLDKDSVLSRDRSVIEKGILCGSKIKEEPLFLLKGTEGNPVMVSLAFVESAYRREVRGMGIEEFVVR